MSCNMHDPKSFLFLIRATSSVLLYHASPSLFAHACDSVYVRQYRTYSLNLIHTTLPVISAYMRYDACDVVCVHAVGIDWVMMPGGNLARWRLLQEGCPYRSEVTNMLHALFAFR